MTATATRSDTDQWGVHPDPPAELHTPWATVLPRGEDGLYREAESGHTRNLWQWLDEIARHGEQGRPRWSRSPGGTLYLYAGDRFALLLPGWHAGHCAVAGDLDGRPLLHNVPFNHARRAAEEWAVEHLAELAAAVDVDGRLS